MKKKETNKIGNIILWLASRKDLIISLFAGVLITSLVATIMWPARIATLKDGTQPVVTLKGKTVTADDLYNEMKVLHCLAHLKTHTLHMLLHTFLVQD